MKAILAQPTKQQTPRRSAIVLLALLAPVAADTPTHELIHSFPVTPYGVGSDNELTAGPDGVLYGGSYAAGEFGCLFKVTPAGEVVPWVYFTGITGPAKGDGPVGRLVLGPDNCFYGTTSGPQINGDNGTIYKVTLAGVVSTLVKFSDQAGSWKGALPRGGLTLAPDGNFYGTTHEGGADRDGTVFRMTPSGEFTTLFEFNGNNGRCPQATLTLGADGNFYGTTSQDGAEGGSLTQGTLFRMTPDGGLTTLIYFNKTGDVYTRGAAPKGRLVLAADGSLYGTTSQGGAYGGGTIFRLATNGTLTTLVNFKGQDPKGDRPGQLYLAADGNFYGATETGGPSTVAFNEGAGTIFRMGPSGGLTTLVTLSGNGATKKGARPCTALAMGTDGNFYGTTAAGGAQNSGTVFRMTPAGTLTTLVEFSLKGSGPSGTNPHAGLSIGKDMNFYGTCRLGGGSGFGAVFMMSPTGTVTPLAQFTGTSGSAKGANAYGAPTEGLDGSLYGSTSNGGTANNGTLFKIGPDRAFTTLVEFTDSSAPSRGKYPRGNLHLAEDGNLYGTTEQGGGSIGTVFRLGTGGAFTSLLSLTGGTGGYKGRQPYAGLVPGPGGKLYGTASRGGANDAGTVFAVTTAGEFTTLVEFGAGGAPVGRAPWGALAVGQDGNLYGTTSEGGGLDNNGTIFRVTPAGVLTTLVVFSGNGATNKGKKPYAGLTLGPDRNFYGTTWAGGIDDNGTVFRVTPEGALTTLVAFTGYGDQPRTGRNPGFGSLVFGPDNNLYGTTSAGGPYQMGTIYRVRLTSPDIGVYDGINPSTPELMHGQADVVDFGETSVGKTLPRSFTILNEGSAPLVVSAPTLPPGFSLDASVNWPETLAPNASRTFLVTLDGVAIGVFAGLVQISSNDGDEPVFTFPVAGTVRAAGPEYQFLSLTFLTPEPEAQLKWGFVPGRPFVVEASTDLISWTALPTAAETLPGIFEFTDPAAGENRVRFYRAVLP